MAELKKVENEFFNEYFEGVASNGVKVVCILDNYNVLYFVSDPFGNRIIRKEYKNNNKELCFNQATKALNKISNELKVYKDRRPFTKAMIKVIEERFDIKLTDEQINNGSIKFEYTDSRFSFASTLEVKISRESSCNNSIIVMVRYKGFDYYHINGSVKNTELKKLLNRI